MNKIIYYVATSLDGFIAGEQDDISAFIFDGPGVDQYKADLQVFKTIIMGRRTYEFGYQYGLKPGQAAYPNMEHHIFSSTLSFEEQAENVHLEPLAIERVQAIRDASPTDVYLCGGGTFAGWLLEHGLIDQLKIKLNPMILGKGVPLFGNSTQAISWKLTDAATFDDGLQILTYDRP